MYRYVLNRVKHFFCFRHKRGYGVHSPFVFDLITNVIREKSPYYAFDELESGEAPAGSNSRKFCRLLYRLAVYGEYRRIWMLGMEDPWPDRYLSAVSRDMEIIRDNDGSLPVATYSHFSGSPYEMICLGKTLNKYWEESRQRFVESCLNGPLCVVVTDIHLLDTNAGVWREYKKRCTVSLDMMKFGILFFDGRLQPGNYYLSI